MLSELGDRVVNERRLSSIWLIGAAIPAGMLFMPSLDADPQIGSRSGPVLTINGHHFRDLDRNGQLDAYEDWRLSSERRTNDLIGRMTLAEKAGTMVRISLPRATNDTDAGGATFAGGYDLTRITTLVRQQGITRFTTGMPPRRFAEQNNAVQAIGEASRLGIPITISTDPRKDPIVVPAGLERFGDVDMPASIIAAVGEGRFPEARIDATIRPIMTAKFANGLFENPYLQTDAAKKVGCTRNCRL